MSLELLFSEKAQLPSFANEDIQKIHYGKTMAAERFNLLQKLQKLAYDSAVTIGQRTKDQFDKHAKPHSFNISN